VTDTTESSVLEITRIFDAPRSQVFEAWLDREGWQSWIGPEGVRCEVPLLERRVGGRYRLSMHLPDGRVLPVTGVFKLIRAHECFAFTWSMEGEPRETLVTVTLRELGDKTELTLRQEGLPGAADREGHAKGWKSSFNKLSAFLSAA
jgi:uncharacterized protein YndB with AHSA1/START domain